MKIKPIYLDNASTTPVDENVLSEMLPYFRENFGNPSAINFHAVEPKNAIKRARIKVGKMLNNI